MARLTSSGNLSGKCGDFVYRNLNGKTVVCSRPGPQKKSTDPCVIARRNRFKLANKLGSALGSIPAMKCIWNQFGAKKNITAYNKMLKDFYPHISVSDIHETFHMGPFLANMSVEPAEFSQDKDKLTAEIKIEYSEFGLENIAAIQMVVLMFLKEPLDCNMPEYEIITLASSEAEHVVNQKIKLEVAIVGEVKEYTEMYDVKKSFCLFAGFDEEHNIIGYSTTFSVA